MKMITIIHGNEAFQVKVEAIIGGEINISVLNSNQSELLYMEWLSFNKDNIAVDYKNEFTKTDAKKVIARYLRYKPVNIPF